MTHDLLIAKLFVEKTVIMSYAGDNTPCVCSENVGITLEKNRGSR